MASFNFGSTSSSGAGNPGQTGTAGLFSSTAAPGTTSTSKPSFNSATTPATGTGLFGAPATLSSSSATPMLGSSTGNTPLPMAGFGKPAGTSTNTPGAGSPFGGGLGSAQTPASAGGGTLFGSPAGQPPTNSLFGNNAPAAGSTTPAPSKQSFNFGTSTTPAGPPPSSQAGGSSLFSNQPKPGPFGAQPALASTQPAGGLFGSKSTGTGNIFGGLSQPGSSAGGTPAATSTAPFGFKSTTEQASSVLATQAPTATKMFGPGGTASTAAPGGLFSSTPASKPANLFSSHGAASTTAPATTTPAPASSNNLFKGLGQPTSSAASTTSATTTSTPAPTGAFGLFGAKTSTTQATTTSAPAAASNMFGAKPLTTQAASTMSSSTAAAPTTGAASGVSGGNSLGGASVNGPALGASTAGPLPQLSRLKNKTMDEIITRWASDLSKYQKDFQDQAAKVAGWDRLLVENGDKIQKLYQSTWEAERETAEVERQLSHVENQQEELTSWLDKYEAEVDDLFARQIGSGDSLQGPDQERERTYKLAEKLTDRLDDMGKNLTSMIEAINDASSSLSKSSKVDDPLSHIVRVLNDHLMQLQWIDQNTTLLQAKVAEAQKLGHNIGTNGYGGLENDAAESFYSSYLGRR